MDGQEKLLDYETIKDTVAGEKWATEKVLAHYADYIFYERRSFSPPRKKPICTSLRNLKTKTATW